MAHAATYVAIEIADSAPSHGCVHRQCSRRTEDAYFTWIRRYTVFHRKTHAAQMCAFEISHFLTWLGVHRRVSASTQNQALGALLFRFKQVLFMEFVVIPPVVRPRAPERLPVVVSRDAGGAILKRLTGTERLAVMLLYVRGSGPKSVSWADRSNPLSTITPAVLNADVGS